ncbi:MAG: 50S ribosomal protein L30 [Capsulimonadales bacterium]|nr:50S ribosomal protein L30 [Capsulimonadales bacterium]
MANKLEITLARSPIGFERSQGLTARALGLTKRGMTVVRPDNDSVRGMVFKIRHLLQVKEIEVAEEAETQ